MTRKTNRNYLRSLSKFAKIIINTIYFNITKNKIFLEISIHKFVTCTVMVIIPETLYG